MYCKFHRLGKKLVCAVCGYSFETTQEPHTAVRECPNMLHAPSLPAKAIDFATSMAKHVAGGSPKCTQEQIDARLKVCKTGHESGSGAACEYFTGESCLACGCQCNGNQHWLNKLYYADQECPVGKWGKVDGVSN